MKKLFSLPAWTPNFFLDLELAQESLNAFTFRMHVQYCQKAVNLPEYRLPRIVALEIIKRNLWWFKHWQHLARDLSCELDATGENQTVWSSQLSNLGIKANEVRLSEALRKASESSHFTLFRTLTKEYKESLVPYFDLNITFTECRWLIKLRGELLYLNYRPWDNKNDDLEDGLCTLCNLKEKEDVFHFLMKCPILSEIRLLHLNEKSPDLNAMMKYLTGVHHCGPLVKFARHAWRFRWDYLGK